MLGHVIYCKKMNILIQQEIFTLRAVYQINFSGRKLVAKRQWFSFLGIIDIYEEEKLIARIKRNFGFFRANYHLRIKDKYYQFISKTILKPSYECVGDEKRYIIIAHKGLKYSIFDHEKQIGVIEKNRIVVGSGDEYKVIVDKKSNPILMISIALIIDNFRGGNNNTHAISIDVGNIMGELKPFNQSWKPE